MESSTFYFHMETKIFADFQICISVPLKAGIFFAKSSIIDVWQHTQYATVIKAIQVEGKS